MIQKMKIFYFYSVSAKYVGEKGNRLGAGMPRGRDEAENIYDNIGILC